MKCKEVIKNYNKIYYNVLLYMKKKEPKIKELHYIDYDSFNKYYIVKYKDIYGHIDNFIFNENTMNEILEDIECIKE